MSKEFRRRIYKEGFLSALVGIENTIYPIDGMGPRNNLKAAYEEGRKHGLKARQEWANSKLFEELDDLYRSYKPGQYGQEPRQEEDA